MVVAEAFEVTKKKLERLNEMFNLQKFVEDGTVREVFESEKVRVVVPLGVVYDRTRNLERPSLEANTDPLFGEWLEKTAKVWKEATEKELEERTKERAVERALNKSRFVRTIMEALRKESLDGLVEVEHHFSPFEMGWRESVEFVFPFAGLYLDYGPRGKRKIFIFLPTELPENLYYGMIKLPPFNIKGGAPYGFVGAECWDVDGKNKTITIVEG